MGTRSGGADRPIVRDVVLTQKSKGHWRISEWKNGKNVWGATGGSTNGWISTWYHARALKAALYMSLADARKLCKRMGWLIMRENPLEH